MDISKFTDTPQPGSKSEHDVSFDKPKTLYFENWFLLNNVRLLGQNDPNMHASVTVDPRGRNRPFVIIAWLYLARRKQRTDPDGNHRDH